MNTNENDVDCDTIASDIDCNDEDPTVITLMKQMWIVIQLILTSIVTMKM